MSTSLRGVITSIFDNFVVITLPEPDGRAIEVPRHELEETSEGLVLRDDATIACLFVKREQKPPQSVLVPTSVLARLPA
jgi:hypothetical protein